MCTLVCWVYIWWFTNYWCLDCQSCFFILPHQATELPCCPLIILFWIVHLWHILLYKITPQNSGSLEMHSFLKTEWSQTTPSWLFLLLCMFVVCFAYMCAWAPTAFMVPVEPEECIRSLGIGVLSESNPHPLVEQPVLLSAEPISLAPLLAMVPGAV